MKIIIVGCSRVGETLAAQLRQEDNDVTMIDLSSDKINSITARYDIMGIVGNGATHTTQTEAGVASADLLIAVTDSDELNLLCCMIAKKSSSKCRVIARVTSPEYSADSAYLKNELGLEMIINPEQESAKEIARILRFPSAIKIEPFAKGLVELLTFKLNAESNLVGMKVKEVVINLKCDILICAVERGGEAFIPNGDFVFEKGDAISIISTPKNAYDFFKKINFEARPAKDAIVTGASRLTHYLCELIENSGISVKVIDKALDACDELCSSFPGITVINGDPADQELLIEEGIKKTDAFLALSDKDEQNILLSLFAIKSGKGKSVTKINRVEYDDITRNLSLDTIIFPKNITADIIVRYVRAMKNSLGSNVETMYNVIKGKVEASEFIVGKASPILFTPLSELKFKSDVLVAAILRDKKVIIPRGHDTINPGDAVVIVSKLLALKDISDTLISKTQTNGTGEK